MSNQQQQPSIGGVRLLKLNQFRDERGAVYQYIKKSSNEFDAFGEVYFSKILFNVVKGWKFHKESIQNLCVPYGKLRIVLFDDRIESSTRGMIDEILLDDTDEYYLLTIPPKIWYSFKSVSSDFHIIKSEMI